MRPGFSSLTALRSIRSQRIPTSSVRFASSNNANVNATVEATQKKAQEALSTLQKTASKVWETSKKLREPIEARAENLLGSYKQPILYNIAVARELAKQIYVAENLRPPTSLDDIQDAYSTLWSRARNPQYWRDIFANGEFVRVGIYGLEAYGIFKIGEIIGRWHLVGYSLS